MYEIIAVRFIPSDDGSHQHVELYGYGSGHMPGEAIMIPAERIIQRQALAERFWVDVNGEKLDVQAGACPVCGFEPQLTTASGPEPLLALPEK